MTASWALIPSHGASAAYKLVRGDRGVDIAMCVRELCTSGISFGVNRGMENERTVSL